MIGYMDSRRTTRQSSKGESRMTSWRTLTSSLTLQNGTPTRICHFRRGCTGGKSLSRVSFAGSGAGLFRGGTQQLVQSRDWFRPFRWRTLAEPVAPEIGARTGRLQNRFGSMGPRALPPGTTGSANQCQRSELEALVHTAAAHQMTSKSLRSYRFKEPVPPCEDAERCHKAISLAVSLAAGASIEVTGPWRNLP